MSTSTEPVKNLACSTVANLADNDTLSISSEKSGE